MIPLWTGWRSPGFAQDLAESADHGEGTTVVAQVEIQAGPLAVAAARATSVSVEIPQTS